MSLFAVIKAKVNIDENDFSFDEKINNIIEDGKQHLLEFHPLLTDEDFERPSRA